MRPARVLRQVKPALRRKSAYSNSQSEPSRPRDRLPKSVAEAAQQALEKRPYYDPANSTLDFSKTNKALFHEISGQCKERTRLRITGPAKAWSQVQGTAGQVDHMKNDAERAISSARISLKSSMKPLSVGDIVLLSKNSTLLHLVVAAPNRLSSNVYTFINHEGEVTFGTKQHISLRIPGVFSSDRTEFMNLVAIEEKRPGMAPVGVPDSAFTRTEETPSSGSRGPSKNPARTPESALSPTEPASASLESGPRDFAVASASAHLLTDTSVNTYIVPVSAREIYSKHFTKISIDAFSKVPSYGNKLDFLHTALQLDDANSLILSPRTVPIFELFEIVNKAKWPEASSEGDFFFSEHDVREFLAQIRRAGGSHTQALGMALPQGTMQNYAITNYSASDYIAFISALSGSGRKWSLNVQKSTKTPISVDVLPVEKAISLETALQYLKSGGIEEITSSIIVEIKKSGPVGSGDEPASVRSPYYASVVQILKDFVSGNISNDPTMESLSGSLVRSIDTRLKAEKLEKIPVLQMPFSFEYAHSRAYEILMMLEKCGDRNPLQWNSSLGLPGTQTSRDSDRFMQLYDYLDTKLSGDHRALESLITAYGSPAQELEGNPAFQQYLSEDFYESDPMAAVREDFGDTPVYCIDSETAHEIDDGISIEDLGKRYAITVHIANPTSYLKPDSSLSQIAFKKGTTVYLPEGPTMMLPGFLSKVCGLNGEHVTRTLGIQFTVSKAQIHEYYDSLRENANAKPLDALAEVVGRAIQQSAKVKFFNVRNFPKNFTYKKVNEVLNDPHNVKDFQNNALEKNSHAHNLFNLHMVADIIRHYRVVLGSGFEVNSDSAKVTVSYEKEIPHDRAFSEKENGWQLALPSDGKSDTPVISITREVNQNRDSKSQHLVSNLMIAANFAGSVFASKNRFPVIFRHSELDVKPSVWGEINKLNRSSYFENKIMNPKERSELLSVMSAANFSTFHMQHHLLGLSLYSNFTSPLRRYVDMVNHWKFQEFVLMQNRAGNAEPSLEPSGTELSPEVESTSKTANTASGTQGRKKKMSKIEKKYAAQESLRVDFEQQLFSDHRPASAEFGMRTSDMDHVACHLQSCELINKKAQKFSDSFWMARFLRQYFLLQKEGKIGTPIQFQFLLGSDAKHGDIRAELIGFGALRTTIVQNKYVMEKFASGQWCVGETLQAPRFRVVKLDFIEGDFTVELVSEEDQSDDII